MKFVVNVSGGLTSFEALERTIKRHGKENTIPVFADTLIEDADLYRFLKDQEAYLGVQIVRLKDGRTPFDVWFDEGVMTAANGYAPCSDILKREQVAGWIKANFGPDEEYTLVFGMEWSEADRMIRMERRYAPVPVWFPLAEAPFIDKCGISDRLEKVGIKVPGLYLEGFEHNNCGGGCVKAGFAHWAHLYRKRPETYAIWEEKEREFIGHVGKVVTILRDRRGGETKPLTLAGFRERIDRGEKYDKNDWGGCGCFSSFALNPMSGLLPEEEFK